MFLFSHYYFLWFFCKCKQFYNLADFFFPFTSALCFQKVDIFMEMWQFLPYMLTQKAEGPSIVPQHHHSYSFILQKWIVTTYFLPKKSPLQAVARPSVPIDIKGRVPSPDLSSTFSSTSLFLTELKPKKPKSIQSAHNWCFWIYFFFPNQTYMVLDLE